MLKRIKQYIDYKGISIAAFERSIGMSNASFGKSLKTGGAIGSDKLEIILRIYPDINPEWLITGKGEMIKELNVHFISGDVVGSNVGTIQGNNNKIGNYGVLPYVPTEKKETSLKELQHENDKLRIENESLKREVKMLTKIIDMLENNNK